MFNGHLSLEEIKRLSAIEENVARLKKIKDQSEQQKRCDILEKELMDMILYKSNMILDTGCKPRLKGNDVSDLISSDENEVSIEKILQPGRRHISDSHQKAKFNVNNLID